MSLGAQPGVVPLCATWVRPSFKKKDDAIALKVHFTFGAKYEIIARAIVSEVSKVKSSREERKARLMKAAEEVIDELLDWSETTAEFNLSQIEALVGRLRKTLGEQMALEVINAQGARQPVPGPGCPECGQEMRYKGPKEVTVESWVGDLRIERGYYHCPDCKVGLFPPRPTA